MSRPVGRLRPPHGVPILRDGAAGLLISLPGGPTAPRTTAPVPVLVKWPPGMGAGRGLQYPSLLDHSGKVGDGLLVDDRRPIAELSVGLGRSGSSRSGVPSAYWRGPAASLQTTYTWGSELDADTGDRGC
jgi:hypothetical protein